MKKRGRPPGKKNSLREDPLQGTHSPVVKRRRKSWDLKPCQVVLIDHFKVIGEEERVRLIQTSPVADKNPPNGIVEPEIKKEDGLTFPISEEEHTPKKLQCIHKGCDATFSSESLRLRHAKRIHPPMVQNDALPVQNYLPPVQNYSSPVSKFPVHRLSFEKPVTKVQFNNSQNEEENFRCPHEDCNAVFVEKSSMSRHMHSVHGALVKCPREGCDRFFKPANLDKHITSVHETEEKVQCTACEKWFSKVRIEKHFEICSGKTERTFQCTYEGCTASFTSQKGLSQHFKQRHGSLVKCPYEDCDRFVKEGYLSKHIKDIHVKVHCTVCDQQISNSNISLHMKICGQGV